MQSVVIRAIATLLGEVADAAPSQSLTAGSGSVTATATWTEQDFWRSGRSYVRELKVLLRQLGYVKLAA